MAKWRVLLSGGLLSCAVGATAVAAPYTADDVLAFTRIAYVVASPNGKQVAYVTFHRSKASESGWDYVLQVKSSHGVVKKIAGGGYIGSVRWSPDGDKIAYITPAHGKTNIDVYQFSSHKSYPIVSLSRSIEGLKWSPSGKQIAFVADAKSNHSQSKNHLINVADSVVNAQLYLVSATGNNSKITALTSADSSIAGSAFGNSFSWSPDGKKIAFSFQPSSRPIDQSLGKVAILNLANHQYTTIPYCINHTCHSPIYSPKGDWLAFESNVHASGKMKRLLEDIDKYKKICVATKSLKVHCLNNTFDKNPSLFGWKNDGQAVFVDDLYKTMGPQLYEINLKNSVPVKQISHQPYFMEPLTVSLNKSGDIFGFGYETVSTAPEPYTATADHFKMHQLASINKQLSKSLGQSHVLNWISTDGTPVQGLLITPLNYNVHHKYPLYVDVHGGPVGAQAKRYLGGSDEFSQAITPTDCAGNILSLGYVVLQVNYRGSGGYGLNFRMKDFGDIGGGDYQDVLTGIDKLVKQGVVDKNNVVVAGWSYGGYLTAWAISQSHRFKAAIDGDGFTDLISFTGTSDDTDLMQRYLGSYFWQGSQKLYWKFSPMAHVKNIKTPLLILQGEDDIRVPIGQAQELYTALKVMQRPVTFLAAPNTSHVPTDPDIIAQEINAIDKFIF